MIVLTKVEEEELLNLYTSFETDPQDEVQPDWVSRKFQSTSRVIRCVEVSDHVVIKQILQ